MGRKHRNVKRDSRAGRHSTGAGKRRARKRPVQMNRTRKDQAA